MIINSFQIIISIIFGAIAGSFGAATGNRLSNDISLSGRSRCDDCGYQLRIIDLIPIISFLSLKGKCRHCNKTIKTEYLLAELMSIGIFLLILTKFSTIGLSMYFFTFLITSSLIGIIVADLQTHFIPDELLITLIVGIVGLIFPLSKSLFISNFMISLITSGIFFCIWWLTEGKGMGFGDVKLVGLLAFWLGKEKIWVGLYLAFLLAAVWGIASIIKNRATLKTRIAFGPFLIFGCLLSLQWGENLMRFFRDHLVFFR